MQNDRMAADMAVELRKENVTCVSPWPGAVMTENISEIISHPKDEKVAHKSIKVLKIRARTFTIGAYSVSASFRPEHGYKIEYECDFQILNQ